MQKVGLGIPEEEVFLIMGLLPARLTKPSGQERQGFRMELLTYTYTHYPGQRDYLWVL